MNTLVSVIMSVYNEKKEWLEDSLDSILKQSLTNLEFIIIVDNPNNKQLIEVVQNYSKKDSRIQYYINDKNYGLVYSLNKALGFARGEYVARMDADDISYPQRLEKQLEFLKTNKLDLVGANVELFNDEQGVFYTTKKLTTCKYITKLLKAGTIGVVHPTFFLRKEVYDLLGGYNNALHVEDKDFLARVLCEGFCAGNTTEVLLKYRYSNQSITKSNAVFVEYMGKYITKLFKDCSQHGSYNFDVNYQKQLKVTKKQRESHNLKQQLMGKAREELGNKKFFSFFATLLKALLHSRSTLGGIRINLVLLYYRFLEKVGM